MEDIRTADHVEIKLLMYLGGPRLWVNVDGVCRLRIACIKTEVLLEDPDTCCSDESIL